MYTYFAYKYSYLLFFTKPSGLSEMPTFETQKINPVLLFTLPPFYKLA
jgi:hypothetical protein